MDRGLDSFRQLQAQGGNQIAAQLAGSGLLPKSKSVAVQFVLAAVMAAGAMSMAPNARAGEAGEDRQERAATQQVQPDWKSTKTAVGAGIGAIAGNVFGALAGVSRTASSAVGLVAGGVIGAVEAGKDKAASAAGAAQRQARAAINANAKGGFPSLSQERDLQMSNLQADALAKRVAYIEALKVAKEAEIDKSLMPNSKDAQQKYRQSVITASKALREERESTKVFNGAFESLLNRYDVSAYSQAYAKLSQRVNIDDSSYGSLQRSAMEAVKVKGSANDRVNIKNDGISSNIF